MGESPTCGRGLAEHAAVPARLADLISALADNLERHLPSLVAGDGAAAGEREVYLSLIGQHRRIAAALRAVSDEMARQRDLPVAPHDETALGDRRVVQAFESYVRVERALASWLELEAQKERRLLEKMRGSSPAVTR